MRDLTFTCAILFSLGMVLFLWGCSKSGTDCTRCHGFPPAVNGHVANDRCERCHGNVVDENQNIIQEALHQNDTVEVSVGCSSCHGWDQGISPPEDLSGSSDPSSRGVGAHEAMRRDAIPAHRVNCSNCHVVPVDPDDPAHIDGDNVAEVTFGMLATAGGAQPDWDGTTCRNVYCHGGTLEGGLHTEPEWTDTSGNASRCGACHRLTDPDGSSDADCSSCHPSSVDASRGILPYGEHINGMIDME